MDQGAAQLRTYHDSDIPEKQPARTKDALSTQQQDTKAELDQGAVVCGSSVEQNSAVNTPHSDVGGPLSSAALAGLTSAHGAPQELLSATLNKGYPSSGDIGSSSSSSSSSSTQDAASEDSSTGCISHPHDRQICFDFTKGLCTRGDKCKYSHDIATIVQFNSKEKGICFDYLRNQCHRGLLCRFSHDLSNIAQQCQSFTSGSNSAMATKNRSGSICYDFVKGVCTRGAECRYSHDLTLIARMARTSNGGAADVDQGPGQQTDVCFDFLRGRCSRGDACKYSHNASLLGGFPGFAPGLLPGAFGNPNMMMDPALAAPFLAGINPQTAAAAAAAAAAAYAAAGSPAANLGNVVNRLGMLGLGGADPAAAAAAAALASHAGALGGMPPGTAGLPGMGGARPPAFDPTGLNNKMIADALHGDTLAMFLAMQQNPLLAGGAGANMRPGPVLPPLSLPPRVPHMPAGRPQPGQPTPEQMMMANAEISRMLEKTHKAVSQGQAHNPLLMQQQMLSEAALTSGLPAPHLATTPKNGALATSAPFPGSADVNMSELLAAAAAAAAAANSAPMAAHPAGDIAMMHAAAAAAAAAPASAANPALLAASAAAMRPGALGMMNPSASAGMPHMPPPGSLASMHRMGSSNSMQSLPNSAGQKHHLGAHGMLPGHGGISASRAGNAQAAAAAAAIAAVAAKGASGSPDPASDAARAAAMAAAAAAGQVADSQGNILPLSRLQEIWSR